MNKQKRFEIIAGLLVGGAIVLAAAPLIMAIFKTTLALVGTFVVGAIALTFAPVFIHQLGIWKYKSLKAMVSRDPINSLIVVQKKRHERIEKGRTHLQEQSVAVSGYKRNCEQMIAKYPAKREELEARQKVFEDMYAFRVDLYKQAKRDYNAAEEQLDYLEMEYDNAVAAYKAGQAFGDTEDFVEKIIEKTAIKAIAAQVDQSVAQMEIAMIDANVQKSIEGTVQHQVVYDRSGAIVMGDILEPIKVRA